MKAFNQPKFLKMKIKNMRLKDDEKSSKIASKNSSSNLNFRVFESKNGVKVNNKTIIFKTNYNEIGYDRKTKRVIDSQENGAKAAANISYIDREKANEKEENEELSNTYNLEKKLEKDELNEIKEELKNGVTAFRRDVISLDFDDELSTEEQLEIIREAYKNFHDDTNKNPKILISLHTNTDHKHAHILVYGEKEDVKINKVQLQSFKVEIATQTANKLENKGLENTLENTIKREEKYLEKLEEYNKVNLQILKIEEKFDKQNEENFKNYIKDLNFSKEELDIIKEKQKLEGFKTYLSKTDKLSTKEKIEKWEKAEKWEAKLNAKIEKFDDNVEDKFHELRMRINTYNRENELKREFKEEQNKTNLVNLKMNLKNLKDVSSDKALDILYKDATLKEEKEKEFNVKIEEKFKDFSKDLNFSKQELEALKEREKVEGYKNYLTNKLKDFNLEKDSTREKIFEIWENKEEINKNLDEKIEEFKEKMKKAQKWEANVDKKIDENLTTKVKSLENKIEEFKDTKEYKDIKEEFKEDLKSNLNLDKALAIKQEEIEDKTLTLEQQIDKKIDGKLDNKQYVFQK
ncbi:MAG: hypothetical protein RBR23_01100 [Arcobacteraceae bacterium]|jgi:hypothetical protein|nr:hypothetical protein [Arcobacteraceae bacterium]